ncbi:phage protein [Staphylococcus epidermidis]|uniref:AbrB/MazE/SpoVT family DNA-binding domain-containing protein n=1 Tax=Staphylococcus epidermidis TaxID=1282 RepID=UPI000E05FB8D|nr:AbrB/MazE/SpoVT family DNA-binding domain-containing protein [Staphylococcus epidermidis]SUM53506.1 phage protein [Staphylococcus epidermidis]SUM53533.1 phage protein [Staphylococcus epidermidis]
MAITSTRKVRKIGTSNVVTLPKEILDQLNIHEGEKLAFNVENGKVSIEAVKKIEPKEADILNMAEEISNQYDKAFKDLVNR